jgi:hypothetical protein
LQEQKRSLKTDVIFKELDVFVGISKKYIIILMLKLKSPPPLIKLEELNF